MADTLRGESSNLAEGLPGARMERSKRLVFHIAKALLVRPLLDRYVKLRSAQYGIGRNRNRNRNRAAIGEVDEGFGTIYDGDHPSMFIASFDIRSPVAALPALGV